MKKIMLSFVFMVFIIGTISAMSISFYYTDNCKYCLIIKPFVIEQVDNYPEYEFIFNDIDSNENIYLNFIEEGFTATPAFLIKTDDCREIKFVGANENELNCELQQMSTKECQTYSAEYEIKGSYFLE